MHITNTTTLSAAVAVAQAGGAGHSVRITATGSGGGIITAVDAMPTPKVITSLEVATNDWDSTVGSADIALSKPAAIRLFETAQDATQAGATEDLKFTVEELSGGGYRLNVGERASVPGVHPAQAGNVLPAATLDTRLMAEVGVVAMDKFTIALKRAAVLARQNKAFGNIVVAYDGGQAITIVGWANPVFARDVVTVAPAIGVPAFSVVIPASSATALAHLEKVVGKAATVHLLVDDPANPTKFGLRAAGVAMVAYGDVSTKSHETLLRFAEAMDAAVFEPGQMASMDRKGAKRRVRLLSAAGDYTAVTVDGDGGAMEAIATGPDREFSNRQRFDFPAGGGSRVQVVVPTKALRDALDAASDNPIANANGDDDEADDTELTLFTPVTLNTANGPKVGILLTRPAQAGVKVFVGCAQPTNLPEETPFGELLDALMY